VNTNVQEVTQKNGDLKIQGKCLQTKKDHSVTIPKDEVQGYHKWRNRDAMIQDAIPSVPRDQREFLISGYSPQGWEELFGFGDGDSM